MVNYFSINSARFQSGIGSLANAYAKIRTKTLSSLKSQSGEGVSEDVLAQLYNILQEKTGNKGVQSLLSNKLATSTSMNSSDAVSQALQSILEYGNDSDVILDILKKYGEIGGELTNELETYKSRLQNLSTVVNTAKNALSEESGGMLSILSEINKAIGELNNNNKSTIQTRINNLVKELFGVKNNGLFGDKIPSITVTNPLASSNSTGLVGSTNTTYDQNQYNSNVTEKTGLTGLTKLQAEKEGWTVVTTANELHNALQKNQKVMLFGNINLNGVAWENIENYTETIEGNGYTISNYAGENALITNATGATIQNLNLEDVEISGNADNTAALISNAVDVTVKNIKVTGNITSTGSNVGALIGALSTSDTGTSMIQHITISAAVNGANNTGGVAGLIEGIRTGSGTEEDPYKYSIALDDIRTSIEKNQDGITITSSGQNVGGVVGSGVGVSIENANILANIQGLTNTGGIAGKLETSFLDQINVQGRVQADNYAGGIAGLINDTGLNFVNFTSGEVTGGNYAGGLVGGAINNSIITNSKSYGNTTGNMAVGGIAGYIENATIIGTHTLSTVTGNDKVGGLVGWANGGNISNVYSAGTVNANGVNTADSTFGGLVGYAEGEITQGTTPTTIMTQEEAEAAGFVWVTTADELQNALLNNQNIALGANIDLSGVDWTSATYSGVLEGKDF